MSKNVNKTITAENQFTNTLEPIDSAIAAKTTEQLVNVIIKGASFVGIVSLQCSFDDGETWYDTGDYWTSDTSTDFPTAEPYVLYQLGVKTGDFVRGSVYVRLGC